MASARTITSDIWADEWFGNLTFMQQALWIGLFSKCADMQGRMRDIPTLIRSQVWPYQDVPVVDIEAALAVFTDAHKIYRYEVNGKLYIQLLRWWAYQCTKFAGESLFPPPPGWIDHVNTDIKKNWTNFKDHAEQELAYIIPSTEHQYCSPVLESNIDPHIHIQNQNYIHIQNHTTTEALARPDVVVVDPPAVDIPKMALIGKLVEDNFGLSATYRDLMKDAIEEYGADELLFALNEKVLNGGRTWKYVISIMDNRKKGIVRPPRPPGNGHGMPVQKEMSGEEMIRLNHLGRESEYERENGASGGVQ
jgi:hypothetical protein